MVKQITIFLVLSVALFSLGLVASGTTAEVKNAPEIPLTTGVYSVPFGASLQDVLKWCEEKNVQVLNDTDKTIREQIKDKSKRLEFANDVLMNDDNKYYTELERMTAGTSDLDIIQKLVAEQVKELLSTCKNPSFIFRGQKYYLVPAFQNKEIENPKTPCADDKITKSTYVLMVGPSEDMKKDKLDNLMVFFYNNNSQLQSYATIAMFTVVYGQENPVETIIMNTLDKKYGQREEISIPKFGGFDNNIWDKIMKIKEQISQVISPLFLNIETEKIFIWGKNIVLNIYYHEGLDYYTFCYYEPNIAKLVLSMHEKGIQKCKEQAQQELNNAKTRAESNF